MARPESPEAEAPAHLDVDLKPELLSEFYFEAYNHVVLLPEVHELIMAQFQILAVHHALNAKHNGRMSTEMEGGESEDSKNHMEVEESLTESKRETEICAAVSEVANGKILDIIDVLKTSKRSGETSKCLQESEPAGSEIPSHIGSNAFLSEQHLTLQHSFPCPSSGEQATPICAQPPISPLDKTRFFGKDAPAEASSVGDVSPVPATVIVTADGKQPSAPDINGSNMIILIDGILQKHLSGVKQEIACQKQMLVKLQLEGGKQTCAGRSYTGHAGSCFECHNAHKKGSRRESQEGPPTSLDMNSNPNFLPWVSVSDTSVEEENYASQFISNFIHLRQIIGLSTTLRDILADPAACRVFKYGLLLAQTASTTRFQNPVNAEAAVPIISTSSDADPVQIMVPLQCEKLHHLYKDYDESSHSLPADPASAYEPGSRDMTSTTTSVPHSAYLAAAVRTTSVTSLQADDVTQQGFAVLPEFFRSLSTASPDIPLSVPISALPTSHVSPSPANTHSCSFQLHNTLNHYPCISCVTPAKSFPHESSACYDFHNSFWTGVLSSIVPSSPTYISSHTSLRPILASAGHIHQDKNSVLANIPPEAHVFPPTAFLHQLPHRQQHYYPAFFPALSNALMSLPTTRPFAPIVVPMPTPAVSPHLVLQTVSARFVSSSPPCAGALVRRKNPTPRKTKLHAPGARRSVRLAIANTLRRHHLHHIAVSPPTSPASVLLSTSHVTTPPADNFVPHASLTVSSDSLPAPALRHVVSDPSPTPFPPAF